MSEHIGCSLEMALKSDGLQTLQISATAIGSISFNRVVVASVPVRLVIAVLLF